MEIGIILSIFSLFFFSSFDISCGMSGSSSGSIDLNRGLSTNQMDPLAWMNTTQLYNYRFQDNAENPWEKLRTRLNNTDPSERNKDQLWKHLCHYLWIRKDIFKDYETTCSYVSYIGSKGVVLSVNGNNKRIRTDFIKCTCVYFDPETGNSKYDPNVDEFHITQYNSATYFILTGAGARNLELRSHVFGVPSLYDNVNFTTTEYGLPDLRQ